MKAKKQKRRPQAGEVIKRKTHKPDAEHRMGAEERMLALQEYAWEKRIDGYSLRDIANSIARDMNLESVPSPAAVRNWILDAKKIRQEKTAEMQESYTMVGLERYERILRVYLPIATGDANFKIRRRQKVGDEIEIIIDEEAFKERAEAAKIVMKSIDGSRRLLGIGASNSNETDQAGAGTTNICAVIVQAFRDQGLVDHVQVAKESGKPVIGRLTLSSGDKDIDELP